MWWVLAALAFAFYFFPWTVAWGRHHRAVLAIGILNLFVGWTGIGWIAALVWACTPNVSTADETSSGGR
jgi:hypothetical protein